jgi:glycerophosphoryl diester phosphodiesterase
MIKRLLICLLIIALALVGIKFFAQPNSKIGRVASTLVNPVLIELIYLRARLTGSPTTRPALPTNRPNLNVKVIAHGTSEKFAPRNTLPAIEAAIEHGVDYIEIDVRYTRDRVPVLLHNLYLEKGTTGSGLLADYSYKELAEVEVNTGIGYWEPGGEPSGVGIPTLEAALKVMQGRVCAAWHPKETPDRNTVQLFQRYGFERGCLLILGQGEGLDNDGFLKLLLMWPDAPFMITLPEPDQAEELLRRYPTIAAFTKLRGMSHETVDAAHRVGVPIYTWLDGDVYDSPKGYALTLDAGYDLVMVDDYDEFITFIAETAENTQ